MAAIFLLAFPEALILTDFQREKRCHKELGPQGHMEIDGHNDSSLLESFQLQKSLSNHHSTLSHTKLL